MRCGSRSIVSSMNAGHPVYCRGESGHGEDHWNGNVHWSSSIVREQWRFRGRTNQGTYYWWQRDSDGATRARAPHGFWGGYSPVVVALFLAPYGGETSR